MIQNRGAPKAGSHITSIYKIGNGDSSMAHLPTDNNKFGYQNEEISYIPNGQQGMGLCYLVVQKVNRIQEKGANNFAAEYENGDFYNGNWQNSSPHGEGTYRFYDNELKDNLLVYSGKFEQG